MIKLEISPAGLRRVILEGSRSQLENELDDLAYRFIRPLISQIDRRLRAKVRESLKDDD